MSTEVSLKQSSAITRYMKLKLPGNQPVTKTKFLVSLRRNELPVIYISLIDSRIEPNSHDNRHDCLSFVYLKLFLQPNYTTVIKLSATLTQK